MNPARSSSTFLAVAIALITYAPPALAYLDPGVGSMVLSAIVGIAATALLAVKTFWYRLKGLFRRGSDERDATAPRSDPGESAD